MKRTLSLGLVLAAVLTPSAALAADTPPRALAGTTAPICAPATSAKAPAVILADAEDPAVFYICTNEIAHRFACPEHTLFVAAEGVCDWEWKVRGEDD
nr:carbohydrate-binding module family 14 protein [Streptomyces sp. SID2563]